jgi:hypothetical protein
VGIQDAAALCRAAARAALAQPGEQQVAHATHHQVGARRVGGRVDGPTVPNCLVVCCWRGGGGGGGTVVCVALRASTGADRTEARVAGRARRSAPGPTTPPPRHPPTRRKGTHLSPRPLARYTSCACCSAS